MAKMEAGGFGVLLRRHRLAAGLTQEELAERAGLSVRGISDLERGINARPRKDTADLLGEALNLPDAERTALIAARGPRSTQHGPRRDPTPTLPPLVGRDGERSQLMRHLRGVGPPVLLFAGEPGIGKSRLLYEAERLATEEGMVVLTGGCQRRSGQEPFAPISDAVASQAATLTTTELRDALRGSEWLVRVLPELMGTIGEPISSGILGPEQERRLVFSAVARFLRTVAENRVMLLILDDLQWAGTDALELLTFLARNSAIRIVAAYRDTEVHPDDPIGLTLGDLAQRQLATQHAIGPLGFDETRALTRALLDGHQLDDVDWERELTTRAGGIPFFLITYVEMIRAGTPAPSGSLPWNIRQSVRQRVTALSLEEQAVLQSAAAIGRTFSRVLLLEAGDRDEGTVIDALDSACYRRLLVEQGDGHYAFAHDLIRETVEADLGAARWALLHRKVAEALERSPDDIRRRRASELAWHYIEAHRPAQALPYAEMAGENAASAFATAEAERHFRTALGLTQSLDTGQEEAEARILIALADVLNPEGRHQEAVEVLERAEHLYRKRDDLEGRAAAVWRLGFALRSRAAPQAGLARIQSVVQELETAGRRDLLCDQYLVESDLLFWLGRYAEALVRVNQAESLARERGHHVMLERAVNMRNFIRWESGGEETDDERDWEDLIRLAEVGTDHAVLEGKFCAAGINAFGRGQFRRAREHIEQFVDLWRGGDRAVLAFEKGFLGYALIMLGEWDLAQAHLEEAVAIVRARSRTWPTNPLFDLGFLHMLRGDWDTAASYLEEAASVYGEEAPPTRWIVEGRLGHLQVLQGRYADAVARLTRLLDQPGEEPRRAVSALTTLALAHVSLGETAHAEELARTAVRRARHQNGGTDLLMATHALGKVLTEQRRWEEAEQPFAEALALARSFSTPYYEALVLADWADLDVSTGDAASAQRQRQEALSIFRRLGAWKDVARLEQELTGATNAFRRQ